jgi:hypothetical protein
MNKTKKRGGMMRAPRSTLSTPSSSRTSLRSRSKSVKDKTVEIPVPHLASPLDLTMPDKEMNAAPEGQFQIFSGLKQIQPLAKMSGDSVLSYILQNYDWDPKEKARLLIELLGETKDKYVKKDIKAELNRLKMEHYSDISNFSINELKKYCDELYLSMTPEELEFRIRFLNEDYSFPEEIANPDTILGRGFYIFWGRGGDKYKPTVLMETIKMNIDYEHSKYPTIQLLTGDEWEEKYERSYYENIYKALIRPIARGGSKRNTIKKRKTKNHY